MTAAEAQARYTLGRLPIEDVAAFATAMLSKGHDGRALSELAYSHDSWRDVEGLFEQALRELGRPFMDRDTAGWILARAMAQAIVDGRIAPLEGASRIYWEWSDHFEDRPAGIREFYMLAQNIEDAWNPGAALIAEMEAEARELAERMLERGPGAESDLEPTISRGDGPTGLEPTL
ncbi:MAG: hypothetical protein JWM80_110 [Cyanobacteria bacterium RYN_339]|nr:hypothetical protein [Cyanobacteria bacterium RYN_339]